MNRIYDAALIAFALACFGVAGDMDMQDATAAESEPIPPALHCREKLFIRVALTADEAAGRRDQLEGMTK